MTDKERVDAILQALEQPVDAEIVELDAGFEDLTRQLYSRTAGDPAPPVPPVPMPADA